MPAPPSTGIAIATFCENNHYENEKNFDCHGRRLNAAAGFLYAKEKILPRKKFAVKAASCFAKRTINF